MLGKYSHVQMPLVLRSDGRAVTEFDIGVNYLAQMCLLCNPGHKQLIHRNKVLHVNSKEPGLIGSCIVIEPINVLPRQISTYTFGVLVESLLNAKVYCMVIADQIGAKSVWVMTEPHDLQDIQYSEEIAFTIDMLSQSSHTQVVKFDNGVCIGLIKFLKKMGLYRTCICKR